MRGLSDLQLLPRALRRARIALNHSGVVNEETVSLGMAVDSNDSRSDGSVV
jgi:hypothetical protein